MVIFEGVTMDDHRTHALVSAGVMLTAIVIT